jgi:A nuclease of the HNH/ENDO VII superfamily with conserved WHH
LTPANPGPGRHPAWARAGRAQPSASASTPWPIRAVGRTRRPTPPLGAILTRRATSLRSALRTTPPSTGCFVPSPRLDSPPLRGVEERVPTIGGRRPINGKLAGGPHPSGVRFNARGFPDYSPYAKRTFESDELTGGDSDVRMANRAAGLARTPKGYVWHHVEDGRTMQLIPEDIHQAVGHTGGRAVIRNGGFDPWP